MIPMSPNPFSPDFGTPPVFFGRGRYIEMLRSAMESGRRPNRSILIEGVRGNGKTALLGRLRDVATDMGWESTYVTSAGAANELAHDLKRMEGRRRVSGGGISIAGFGASISTERSPEGVDSTLRQVLLDHMERSGTGLLILMDELQKIGKTEAQAICDALNAARENGFDIALVMAGLPGSHERIRTFEYCTYMVRSTRLFLPMLGVIETMRAVDESFDLVPELSASSDVRGQIASFTRGHPYLIQLMGYDLYEQVREIIETEGGRTTPVAVTSEMLHRAQERSYETYAENVLSLVLGNLGKGTIAYLRALASTIDGQGIMKSDSSVADRLGKKTNGISTYRTRMIAAGLLEDVGRGKVAFRIPFIPRYLEEDLSSDVNGTYILDNEDRFPMT